MTREQTVRQAVAFHNRDHAEVLARLLLESLHLGEATSRSSDLYAWRGEVSFRTEHEEMGIAVSSSVKDGVDIVLTFLSGKYRVEQIIPCIRTPQDWKNAVDCIQEQLEDMESEGLFGDLEDALDEEDAPRLADLVYEVLDVDQYAEPNVWAHPQTGEVQVSFDLQDTTHVIVSVIAARSRGVCLRVTANRIGDEDDPGLGWAVKGIRTEQAWAEAVQVIRAKMDALVRERGPA